MSMYEELAWAQVRFQADTKLLRRMQWAEMGARMWMVMKHVYEALGRTSPSLKEGVTKAEQRRFKRRK